MLTAFAEEARGPQEQGNRMELDEFLCMLEVLQLMQLAPAVADAVVPSGSSLEVGVVRSCPSSWAHVALESVQWKSASSERDRGFLGSPAGDRWEGRTSDSPRTKCRSPGEEAMLSKHAKLLRCLVSYVGTLSSHPC